MSIAAFALLITVFPNTVFSGQASYDMPSEIDPSARYLFFLHNYYVEKNGINGACKYNEILQSFEEKGFVVISEVRSGKIIPCTYSASVVEKVKLLLDSGVPPQNIIVSGHSKGGVIALCIASQLANPKISYVIMAGCEIEGVKKYKMYPDFANLKGRMLSIYALSDKIAGSCEKAFALASKELSNTEIKLKHDAGHKVFFKPDGIWISPIVDWINKGRSG
jgi:predicted esterase